MTLKPGREFAANSWVHTQLADNAPIDPMSATWVAEFHRMMMANQGGVGALLNSGPPLYIVGPDQPTSRVVARDPNPPIRTPNAVYAQSRWNAVPIPNPDTFVVQQASDAEVMIYQPSTKKYWEFWAMARTGRKVRDSTGRLVDEWAADWGGRMDNIDTNPGWWITDTNFPGYEGTPFKPGMVAAGIPMLAFYMTLADILEGEIKHPVGITLGTGDAHGPRWNSPPAQRTDGLNDDLTKIPEGLIFRLPANLDLEAYPLLSTAIQGQTNVWRMIAEAMKRYGMVTFDKGGTSVLFAENCMTPAYHGVDPYEPLVASGKFFNFLQFTEFPWNKMQVLKTNLVSP
jgi:hypothetical protein